MLLDAKEKNMFMECQPSMQLQDELDYLIVLVYYSFKTQSIKKKRTKEIDEEDDERNKN